MLCFKNYNQSALFYNSLVRHCTSDEYYPANLQNCKYFHFE